MRRMYSKKQLEELISQMSGDILEVKNVKQLNDVQCDNLKVGDVVAKKTGKQYHLYLVTYKQDKHGLCLTYFDASVIETQSYDYTNGHWVYNSEDKTPLVNVEGAPTGEIQDALGLDSEGNLVKGAVSGGTKLYKHTFAAKAGIFDTYVHVFTTSATPITATANNALTIAGSVIGSDWSGSSNVSGTIYYLSVVKNKNAYNLISCVDGTFSIITLPSSFTDTVTEL